MITERISFSQVQEPTFRLWGNVHELVWEKPEGRVEFLLSIATNKRSLQESAFLISRLNGAHPSKVAEIEDAYVLMSADESIELYETPQQSDSETSEMTYVARARDRSFYAQNARQGQLASIHSHELEIDIWEKYKWIRGKLGLLLPDGKKAIVDQHNREVTIPGGVKHQAEGLSKKNSVTIITTTAKKHIFHTSL